ncbi:hypothetical protein Taro_004984, partial [Colocasia esculenta]|nr:hypothetical protein [Colocasia esculenta]
MLRTQSKNMKNWSSSVDTGSSSVNTRDRFDSPLVDFKMMVAADTTGKKNGLVWMISCSPATKNFSTRPQQVLKLVPRVAADTTGKKNGLVWMISYSPATKNFSTRPQQV